MPAPVPAPAPPPAGALVTGKITHNGQPLAGGTVAFVTREGVAHAAEIADDGSFSMRTPPGDYIVTIRSASADTNDLPAKYADAHKSDLRVSVRDGDRNDLVLT